jgi:hypothetical protein
MHGYVPCFAVSMTLNDASLVAAAQLTFHVLVIYEATL